MVEISQILGTTVVEFIDYALVVVVVLIIYYGLRIFTVGRRDGEPQPGSQAAAADLISRGREHVRQRAEEQQQQQEARRGVQERRRWLGRAVGRLARMIENTNRARASLGTRNARNLTEANGRIRDIEADLRRVLDTIALAQRNLRGERRAGLGQWYGYVEAMRDLLRDEIIAHMPPDANDNAAWNRLVPSVQHNLNEFRTRCGAVMDALQDFIDNDNLGNVPGVGGARAPGGGPSGGPSGAPHRRPVGPP